ncbi:MAG: 3-phosphoshikimate 1-carboxyvinyltransferase [Firmicutes bacterium]|nr:3-phosphoshikimate 1-carboxyvinyltransferase [Bacillota bacterium]
MMADRVVIHPASLRGEAHVPTSKSLAHRAILCAALAEGVSRIYNISLSEDIEATLNVAKVLGASYHWDGTTLVIQGIGGNVKDFFADEASPVKIDCGESGSTLRFVIPILSALGIPAVYSGRGKLPERPLSVYYELFNAHKVAYETTCGKLPLLVSGGLKGGQFEVDGSISSQFITGLLFALPLVRGDRAEGSCESEDVASVSQLTITGKIESAPYIELTLSVLKAFGVQIIRLADNEFEIPAGQRFHSCNYTVEADASQAAFLVAAAGGCLTPQESILIPGMHKDTAQGDKAFVEAFNAFGGHAVYESEGLRVFGLSDLKTESRTFDASQCPDIVPILAVLGCCLPGSLRITGCARLRIKESDRLHAITDGVSALGASICEEKDDLVIEGGFLKQAEPIVVSSFNDHRIAMAISVAALISKQTVAIEDASCVKKSWPSYWHDLEVLFPGSVETIK